MTEKNSLTGCGADGLRLTLELALKVPLKAGEPQSLMSAYALIPEKLFPLLSRFLLRHNLNFRSAVLPGAAFAEKYLVWLSCGDKSPGPIPDFILAYIKNLPFCYLFQGFSSLGKKSLFLCEYGFKHPFALVDLAAATAETGLYIKFAGERADNSIIRPVPEFLPESSVLQYEVGFPLQQFDYVAQVKPEKLLLPLRFINYSPGSSDFAPVLFLEGREIVWLKEMLYRLPGPLFTKIAWAGSQESLFLFFNDSAGISFFPFGQPFSEIASNLFIPADEKIVPQLEPELLLELFQVESDYFSFVTGSWRRDLPVSAKAPLRQLLTFASDIKVEFKPDSNLDGFLWEDPLVETVRDISLQPVKLPESPDDDLPAIPVSEQLASGTGVRTSGEGENSAVFIRQTLKDYGVILRQQGDYLGAATCFSLAQESSAAADCYAAAALVLAGE